MKIKILTIILVSLLIIQIFLAYNSRVGSVSAQTAAPSVFVGVDVAYNNLTAAKQLADTIKPYANLFIIGTTAISEAPNNNVAPLDDLCQYLYDRGFYFIIFRDYYPSNEALDNARKWGDRFLGYYAYDEPGGRQLDQAEGFDPVTNATDYGDASNQFTSAYTGWLRTNTRFAFTKNYAYPTEFPLFTSDYALYYYDYKAGYDTVFAELGWNYSRQLNIALCRGAATVQNKDWGTMILWTYTNAPYLESASELYKDMVLAYDNGAKYICIFDTNSDYTQEILTQEHLEAMKQFWQYTQNNPRNSVPSSDRVAYVLPQDCAFGFRGPNDKIWGLWEASEDPIAYELSISVNIIMNQYGSRLDLVYEDALQQGESHGYSNLIYWNDPDPVQPWWPDIPVITTPDPNPTLTPSPTPSLTPTPTPSPIPSIIPTLTPTSTSSPSPTQTLAPTCTANSLKGLNLKMNYIYLGAGLAGASALIVTFTHRRRRTKNYS